MDRLIIIIIIINAHAYRKYLFVSALYLSFTDDVEFSLFITRDGLLPIILPILFCRAKARASGTGLSETSCCWLSDFLSD